MPIELHVKPTNNVNPNVITPVPVSVRSKVWVWGRSPAEIVGSNPTGEHGRLSVVLCCQVEVSATSWSLFQRSTTDCDVSLCVI